MRGLLLFLITPNFLIAQITITNLDLPISGSTYYYSNVLDVISVDVVQTGPNYYWDFSALNYFDQDSLETVLVGNTPLPYQFYFNNPFLYPEHFASFAHLGQDLSLMSTVNISDRYDYYKTNSSSYELVGFGANVNGLPASVKYDTIDQIYPLPMNYGTTDSSSAYYLSTIPSLGTYGQWIRRKVEVDGWGTVLTPFSSYDVLRIKTTLYQRDTIYIDQLMLGSSFNRPVTTIYEWYSNGEGVPVFTATAQNGIVSEIKYKDDLHVSINEIAPSDFQIYPNPFSDFVYFKCKKAEILNVEIYDIQGKKVANQEGGNEISLAHLKNGFYIFKVNINDQNKTFNFLKF